MEWQMIERQIAGIIENDVSVTIHGEQDYEVDAGDVAERVAQALINALWEPTEAMIDAGDNVHDFDDSMSSDADEFNRHNVRCIWQAMMNAAQGTSPREG